MYQYSVVQWLFIFYFYCFFGWCFESGYVSIKNRKWVNRGFMRGPFLPLYGSGGVMMLLVSRPFVGHPVLVYLAGCVGATALEYVTGVAMEALFKVRYWDYSNQKLNFQGHICLSSTLAWGALTLLMTNWIHKPVECFVFWLPEQLLSLITFLLTAVIFADFSLSFKAALDLRDVLVKLEKAKEELAHMQKRLDVLIALTGEDLAGKRQEFVGNLAEKREELKEGLSERKELMAENAAELKAEYEKLMDSYKREWEKKTAAITSHIEKDLHFVLKGNPSMNSRHFKESFEQLKKRVEERRHK